MKIVDLVDAIAFWATEPRKLKVRVIGWRSLLLGGVLFVAVIIATATVALLVMRYGKFPVVPVILLLLVLAAFLRWILWLLPWRLRPGDPWGIHRDLTMLLWVAPSPKPPGMPPRMERPTVPERFRDNLVIVPIIRLGTIIFLLLVSAIALTATAVFHPAAL